MIQTPFIDLVAGAFLGLFIVFAGKYLNKLIR